MLIQKEDLGTLQGRHKEGQSLALPLGTLVLINIPYYYRIAKSSVLQVTNEEFITTFRATGMSERKIFNKYVFKNAILPVVTVFGITMAFLISGVTLIETVFAWPGTGRLTLTAINQRDYTVLMGMYLVVSVMVALTMIVVDIVLYLNLPGEQRLVAGVSFGRC